MRTFLFLLAGSLLAPSLVACQAPTGDDPDYDDTESTLVTRVKGSATGSAYAKKTATYLSVRRIDVLASVGALPGAIGAVVQRADGIIANQPADGRISLKELQKLEQPGFINTLFPEEKAALPKVWEIMETIASAPTSTPALAATPAINVTDLSKPATTLVAPKHLSIAALPPGLRTSAQRVQMTHDADGDPSTIAPADLSAVIANPGPYTPDEEADFKTILDLFKAGAVSSVCAVADVPVPGSKVKVIAAFGGATLTATDRVSYSEFRDLRFFSHNSLDGSLDRKLEGVVARTVTLTAPAESQIVVIQETTEAERVLDPAHVALEAGAATMEIWSNGIRQASYRFKITGNASESESHTDLTKWADFELRAGGVPLAKNVVSAATTWPYPATDYRAFFAYETASTPLPPNADITTVNHLATPTNLVAGRYEFAVPSRGTFVLEVTPSGVVWLTRPGTSTEKAEIYVWSDQASFSVVYPDLYRMILNPSTGQVEFFLDGHGFDLTATLDSAARTG